MYHSVGMGMSSQQKWDGYTTRKASQAHDGEGSGVLIYHVTEPQEKIKSRKRHGLL